MTRSRCSAFVDETGITDLNFADDVGIFIEFLDQLRRALLSLNEEEKPLGLRDPWVKINIQYFVGLWEDSNLLASVVDK